MDDYFADLQARRAREAAARLAQADREGKEPFDEARYRELYAAPHGTYPTLRELEYDYYVTWEHLKTLAQYADACRLRDLHDGGDLHLD